MTSGGFLISVGVAMVLCITLEFPFTALLKELTGGKLDEGEKPDESEKKINVEMSNGNNNVYLIDETKERINNNSHEVRL